MMSVPECDVCFQQYDSHTKFPVLFKICGHSLCALCIPNLSISLGNIYKCPLCRTESAVVKNITSIQFLKLYEEQKCALNDTAGPSHRPIPRETTSAISADEVKERTVADNMLAYKIVLLGDGSTGKTTYVNRPFEIKSRHVNAYDADLYDLIFISSRGGLKFTVWDKKINSSTRLPEEFFKDSRGAILMFDTSAPGTYHNLSFWYTKIQKKCGSIPIVICGNKVDIEDRKVRAGAITFPREKNLKYCDISGICNHNFQQPFLHLAREIMNVASLEFFSCPLLCDPEISMDPALIQKYTEELHNAEAETSTERKRKKTKI